MKISDCLALLAIIVPILYDFGKILFTKDKKIKRKKNKKLSKAI